MKTLDVPNDGLDSAGVGRRFTRTIGFLSNFAIARSVLSLAPLWIDVKSPVASFRYFSPARDDLRLRALAGFEGWEDGGRLVAAQVSRRAEIVVDVGAYTGVYSLLAAAQNPSVQVFAIEPVEKAARAIEKSAAANHFSQVKVVRAVASRSDGVAVALLADLGRGTSTISVEPEFHPGPTVKVEERLSIRLDSLNLRTLDLLKVDVEGHELAVLQGAELSIGRSMPLVLVELLSDEALWSVTNLMESFGYRLPQLVDSKKRNFLFIPKSGKWKDWGFSGEKI